MQAATQVVLHKGLEAVLKRLKHNLAINHWEGAPSLREPANQASN
jgi:hypothetical protein